MSSNTPNLGLLKKDPMTDGNETFNIQTMLNDNWDKIDDKVGQMSDELGNITIPDASLTVAGKTMLSNSITGTRENVAATEKAVKLALDKSLSSVPDASLTVAGKTMLSNAINGTRQNVAATEYAVKTAMENVKVENYDGRTEEVFYYVPSQYPTIQAALNAIKLHNAGDRTIQCAAGYRENGEVRFPAFMSGVITVSGDYSSPTSITGDITIMEAQCLISLKNLNLVGAQSMINCQTPCIIYVFSVNKTVSGTYDAFWFGGQCKAYINFCTISNQLGNAIKVFSNATAYCAVIKGTGNGTAFSTSSGIIFDDGSSSNSISATTRVYQTSGGRVFS
ncbi:tail fiber protein [Paenibacillus cineris]|uniref:tail fiber protein n=1 Tax=Paenibacillus cineris TaxID=237530 RepID=UPI001B2C6F4A|nr:tail fiber protein [Paenibacillus cineris]GIO63390.1 hypothetical protein J43TS9_49640 [Paenibacillus cineris]